MGEDLTPEKSLAPLQQHWYLKEPRGKSFKLLIALGMVVGVVTGAFGGERSRVGAPSDFRTRCDTVWKYYPKNINGEVGQNVVEVVMASQMVTSVVPRTFRGKGKGRCTERFSDQI